MSSRDTIMIAPQVKSGGNQGHGKYSGPNISVELKILQCKIFKLTRYSYDAVQNCVQRGLCSPWPPAQYGKKIKKLHSCWMWLSLLLDFSVLSGKLKLK